MEARSSLAPRVTTDSRSYIGRPRMARAAMTYCWLPIPRTFPMSFLQTGDSFFMSQIPRRPSFGFCQRRATASLQFSSEERQGDSRDRGHSLAMGSGWPSPSIQVEDETYTSPRSPARLENGKSLQEEEGIHVGVVTAKNCFSSGQITPA